MAASKGDHQNLLAGETSPYLLQHKHNPVDWRPWGPAALAEARRTNKPILLSIGYAACHWCHVMAHESFEDEDTARVMNELFVNIKVDREERPDIDQIYMSALHHLGEQGGWPLTMFLTPAGEPVWGGTYFPKVSSYGRPAFVEVLREIARMFREEPGKIEQNRTALMSRLAETARTGQKNVVGKRELDSFALQIAGLIDTRHGGMRGAPKFPQASLFEFLWRAGMRESPAASSRRSDPHPNPPPQAGEGRNGAEVSAPGERFFALVELTLERICEGGIYDHLGGGFSRYSVDDRWLVPHFEKMLYDNAQLLELLALAYARKGNSLFLMRARETISWLQREMTTGEGAFAASLDADSEGEEGKFYVWSLDEIMSTLGTADGEFFARHYDVSAAGNFEGHNILNRLARIPREPEDETRLAPLRQKLLAVRGKRVRPGLDDKVLADWNGLMIAALVNAGAMLGEPAWIKLARRAFDFITRDMTRGDRLGHSWRAGKLLFPGLASDFAAMISAALALHEATGERSFLDQALQWQAAFDRHYANDATGGYYLTADDAEGLVVRPAGTSDDATPNPNAVAAQNLVRLALITGDDAYRARADRLIEGVLAGTDNHLAHIALLNAIDLRIGAAEIVVTGREAERFAAAALKIPFLNRIVLRATSADALPASHPAQQKIKATTETAAFICVGERCSMPVTRVEQIADAVAGMRAS